ncbi:MAG: nitroreductase family protein, partial [Lentisphaerae bacterium]
DTSLDPIAFILKRRSVRQFTGEKVNDEQIDLLLKAAMAAPSACCRDPWHFIVLRDPENCRRLAEHLPNGKFLPEAGCGIIVCGRIPEAHGQLVGYLLEDCSAAIENILLAVPALGLGACWLGVYPREERVAAIRELFGVPQDVIPVGVVAVGHPREVPPPRTRYTPEKVHSERW